MLVYVEKYSCLPKNKIVQLKNFIFECNRLNKFETLFHFPCLQSRSGSNARDFLFIYDQKLIAAMSLYDFQEKEIEIDLIIHPSVVNSRSLFNYMISTLMETIEKEKIYSCIFRIHRNNKSIYSYLNSLNKIKYLQSDYILTLAASKTYYSTKLYYKKAGLKDVEEIFKLHCLAFDNINTADYKYRLRTCILSPKREILLFYNQENILIGKSNLRIDENYVNLHDFCVSPEKQGLGYGKEILKIISPYAITKYKKQISLEVSSEDEKLLQFYKKLGFKSSATQDYYHLYSFRRPIAVPNTIKN